MQRAHKALAERVTTSGLTINCTKCLHLKLMCLFPRSVALKAVLAAAAAAAAEWVRWEGGVLSSNQTVFRVAPVNKPEKENHTNR